MDQERSKIIVKSGYLFIATNFLLAALNLLAGLLSGSLAITSDAEHSLIDSLTGFLVVLSEKYLAKSKKPKLDRNKIERTTTIVIAIIIIAAGIHIVVESIESLQNPEPPEYSIWVFIVLALSIALKFALARTLKLRGKKYKSAVLTASAAETMNDMLISLAVFASLLFFMAWQVNIEPYISLIIAAFIIKIGLEFIFPHLSKHHHHPLEQNPDHDHCGKSAIKKMI